MIRPHAKKIIKEQNITRVQKQLKKMGDTVRDKRILEASGSTENAIRCSVTEVSGYNRLAVGLREVGITITCHN